MKHFADLDAATEQLGADGLDVGNDQVQALRGAGSSRGDVLAENDRAAGARRRELDHAEVVLVSVVGVEPPSELRVELLRAIDVGDGEKTISNFMSTVPAFASLLVSFVGTRLVLMAASFVVLG